MYPPFDSRFEDCATSKKREKEIAKILASVFVNASQRARTINKQLTKYLNNQPDAGRGYLVGYLRGDTTAEQCDSIIHNILNLYR